MSQWEIFASNQEDSVVLFSCNSTVRLEWENRKNRGDAQNEGPDSYPEFHYCEVSLKRLWVHWTIVSTIQVVVSGANSWAFFLSPWLLNLCYPPYTQPYRCHIGHEIAFVLPFTLMNNLFVSRELMLANIYDCHVKSVNHRLSHLSSPPPLPRFSARSSQYLFALIRPTRDLFDTIRIKIGKR